MAAKLVLDGRERVGTSLSLSGKTPGRRWHRPVAVRRDLRVGLWAVVGGNRVENDFRALRHFDGDFPAHVALVIVAVGEDDESVPDGTVRIRIHQLLFAGFIDGIVQCRSAARTKAVNALR